MSIPALDTQVRQAIVGSWTRASQAAALHAGRLANAVEAVLEIHKPFRIFDECDHHHEYAADGSLPEGVQEIENIGLVCEDGYQYSICRSCCTEDSGYQVEHCADVHRHDGPDPCWPCPTARAIAAQFGVGPEFGG
jgi:hypothetical protein